MTKDTIQKKSLLKILLLSIIFSTVLLATYAHMFSSTAYAVIEYSEVVGEIDYGEQEEYDPNSEQEEYDPDEDTYTSGYGDDDQDDFEGSVGETSGGVRSGGTTGGVREGSTADSVYTPLAPIPGINAGEVVEVGSYINALLKVGLWLMGLFAVLMLVVAGTQYIAGGANESLIGDAKSKMTNVFIGLFIGMSAVLLLGLISPDLLKTGLNLNDVDVRITKQDKAITIYSGEKIPGKFYFKKKTVSQGPEKIVGPFDNLGACWSAEGEIDTTLWNTTPCSVEPSLSGGVVNDYYFWKKNGETNETAYDGPYKTESECDVARKSLGSPWRSSFCVRR